MGQQFTLLLSIMHKKLCKNFLQSFYELYLKELRKSNLLNPVTFKSPFTDFTKSATDIPPSLMKAWY